VFEVFFAFIFAPRGLRTRLSDRRAITTNEVIALAVLKAFSYFIKVAVF